MRKVHAERQYECESTYAATENANQSIENVSDNTQSDAISQVPKITLKIVAKPSRIGSRQKTVEPHSFVCGGLKENHANDRPAVVTTDEENQPIEIVHTNAQTDAISRALGNIRLAEIMLK